MSLVFIAQRRGEQVETLPKDTLVFGEAKIVGGDKGAAVGIKGNLVTRAGGNLW